MTATRFREIFLGNCLRTWTLAIVLSALSSAAFAQPGYKELPLNSDLSTWAKATQSQQHKDSLEMLSGAQQLNSAKLDSYFSDVLLPFITQWQDKNVGRTTVSPLSERYGQEHGPAGIRIAIKNTYVNKGSNAAAHEELNNVLLKFMDTVANDNYHPVVRVNAILLIGDLNETDPNGAPWKKALPALLKTATANGPVAIDGVRVEALRGLVRHARDEKNGIDPELRGQVITGMLGILAQHAPPAGRSQDGHDWICWRAIDVLSAIGEPGANNAVPQALIAIINDPAASITIRCAAADALGKIKFTPAKDFDVTTLAKSFGKLAIAAVSAELTAKAPLHSPITTERLRQDFIQISHGLTGDNGKSGVLAWTTDAAVQRFISLIDTQLKSLMQACDKQPLPQPANSADKGGGPVVPIDTQKPIVDALNAAVEGLKTILDRGEAAPAAATATPAAAGKAAAPDFN